MYNLEQSNKIRALNIGDTVYLDDVKLQFTRSKYGIRVCNKIKNKVGEVIQMTCRDLNENAELVKL